MFSLQEWRHWKRRSANRCLAERCAVEQGILAMQGSAPAIGSEIIAPGESETLCASRRPVAEPRFL